MTLIASIMKIIAITANTISCLTIIAIKAMNEPIESEPMSPIKIWAGYVLNHKKPIPAPIMAPQRTSSSPVPSIYGMYKYSEAIKFPADHAIKPKAAVTIITGKIASPSNPSVRFTAFELPTSIKTEIKIKKMPKSRETVLKNGTI